MKQKIEVLENMEGKEARRSVEENEESWIDIGMLSVVSEPIKEEEEDYDSDGSLFSIDIDEDRVYVAVGKSMEVLLWTLKHAISPSYSTILYLIHVFPLIRLVPSPLGGMLPRVQANQKAVDKYLERQRAKRKKLLQTYLDACSAFKVRVEFVVVESDNTGKAISDLILSLNINRLILGSTKSTLTKVKSKGGTASQILENAPQTCEINIICKGKQVSANEDKDKEPQIKRSQSQSQSHSHSRSSSGSDVVSLHAWKPTKWSRTNQFPLSSYDNIFLK